jgi:predicted nucleic acid-binding protein
VALFYVDASALVKLIGTEPESAALGAYLDDAGLVASELVLAEVPRAIRRAAADDPRLTLDRLIQQAAEVLDAVALLPLDRGLLATAGALAEPGLQALDAIHVVSAVDVSPLDAFVSHDERQSAAARLAGLRTMAPALDTWPTPVPRSRSPAAPARRSRTPAGTRPASTAASGSRGGGG